MRRNSGGEGLIEGAEVLVLPEITQVLPAVEAGLGPIQGDGRLLRAAVEKTDGLGAPFQFLDPDFETILSGDPLGRKAQGILINGQHFSNLGASPCPDKFSQNRKSTSTGDDLQGPSDCESR